VPPTATLSLAGATAAVVQFRPGNRLRMEIAGDAAAGSPTINALGPLAIQVPSPITLTASVDMRFAGGNSIIPTGPFTVVMPSVAGEAVVVGTSPQGDIAEVVWPSLDPTLPPGPPILRIQLARWNANVKSGSLLDADFTLKSSTGPTWAGVGRNMPVP
jgi:hypothetical protein